MAERLLADARGVDGDHQPFVDFALADHVLHPLRAQDLIVLAAKRGVARGGLRFEGVIAGEDRLAGH